MGKYVIQLHPEERPQLLALVNTGRAAAAKLLHARIVRNAEGSGGGRHWTDAAIATAVDTSAATVHRGRQAVVAWGLETARARKLPPGRHERTLAGAQAAHLLAVACRAPPAGRPRWPRKLLAATLVALDLVATLRAACVRPTLTETSCNRGSNSKG